MTRILHIDRHAISPYALTAFVALHELQVPFTLRRVDLGAREHDEDAFRAITGRVPALEESGFWLAESSAIVEFLAEQHDRDHRLLPRDPRERAIVRQLQAWVRSDLLPLRTERSTHTVWYSHADTPLTAAGLHAKARVVRAAEAWLATKPWVASSWSIGDVDLAMMLRRLSANGDALPSQLTDYVARAWERPSMRAWDALERPAYVPY